MPTLSTTYLLPAILLNPAFILHLINTFVSHMVPPPLTVSHSPHPFMESIGPVPGSKPYLDMHANDQLCWRYTVLMVIVQLLAFGRVQDNRVQRKSAKAAKLEREKLRKEKLEKMEEDSKYLVMNGNGHAVGMNGTANFPEGYMDGAAESTPKPEIEYETTKDNKDESTSEGSLTETSEEEMIV
jgi:hypothetical protein